MTPMRIVRRAKAGGSLPFMGSGSWAFSSDGSPIVGGHKCAPGHGHGEGATRRRDGVVWGGESAPTRTCPPAAFWHATTFGANMTPQEQRVFELVRLELKPEMVPPEYRDKVKSDYCGHCHHATLAMYVLLGGKTNGYKVRKAVDELQIKHYWLESPTGVLIDPTAEQYTDLGRPLPYANKVNKGLSYLKSNHAKAIILAVQVTLRHA